jgi:hypothetical protein
MRLLSLFISLFSIINLSAQCPSGPGPGCDGSGTSLDLFWVGTTANNSGDWNSPCSWRVGSVAGSEPCQAPRSIDNVFFTSLGFTGGGTPTIAINTQARCNNFLVDPTINGLGVTPEFSLNNPGFMEIYGDFTLQSNLIWTVVGGNSSGPEILFKATTVGHTITTAGHTMGAVQFDGIGGEWSLQDDYNGGSINFVFGYLNTSDGTNSYNMNILTFDSDIQSGALNTNRRLDLNSSIITLTGSAGNDRYPYNTTNAPKTVWESRNSDNSNFNFNASNSQIIFTTTSPFIRLGGLDFNVINHTGTGRLYDHFGNQPCNIDTLETNGYLYFHHEHNFNVLKINSTSQTHNFFRNQVINIDLIVNGNPCNPTEFKSEYNRTLTMPSVVSADPMNGFLINNLKCSDGTAGHIVNGFSQGTTTGWTITPPLSRDLYWVGNTNTNWSEPSNWSTSNTGLPLLTVTDCPPTQNDNVFFIPSLANGKTCNLNQDAFCNDMTWTITAPTTFSGNNQMNIYGNLQFDADINLTCTQNFNFYGTGNTILSAGLTFPATTYIQQDAIYTLLDDINFTFLYLFRQDGFNSNGFNLTGNTIYFRNGVQNFSGSTITLASNVPWYISGNQGTTTYNASSNVIFTNSSPITSIYGWGPNLKFPNFTLQSPNTTLRIKDYLGVGYSSSTNNIIYEGSVTFNGNVRYFADYGNAIAPSNIAQMIIYGDLNLNAGKTYEFGVNNTITISGNLNALGNCTEQITIKGINSFFGINITGSANLDYCVISDMNSIGSITATNSLDAGNNTNVTFPISGTTTYYWRAKFGSCSTTCIYDGDWNSSDGYWTTIQSNIEGTPGCIPTASDNVVFDNMSFSGIQTNVSIPVSVACHNITVNASNVKWSNNSTLTVTGSISSDGTLQASTFSGAIDFNSNNGAGETIDFGGVSLGCDIIYSNSIGNWTLINNPLITTKDLYLNRGTLNTNNLDLTINRFYSDNSNIRALNLGSSNFNINGSGTFFNITSPINTYTWNTNNISNFSFNAGTSTINFSSTSEPTIKSGPLNLYHVNFTNTSSTVATSPVLLVNNWNTEYMKFDCSARIYGDNAYDTLEFTAGNVYHLESGKTQTLNAPDGILISTGSAGQEIAIKSTTTGSPATFHKLNTGGSMSSFCIDYVSVEDNFASSDDPIFTFFTGINSNNISASGIWDFNRPLFVTPSIESAQDQSICSGTSTTISWNITGSGPYTLSYTENGANPTTITLPNGTPSYSVSVTPTVSTTYTVSIFSGDNCGSDTPGTLIDAIQIVNLPSPAAISQHLDTSTCTLNNEATFINFHENQNGTNRPLVSVSDDATGSGLGNVTTTIRIDPTVQFLNGIPYLQRRFGVEPTINESAKVRLYFTQAELDALSTAWGSTLTTNDLMVTKYSNNVMNFTGAAVLLTPTTSGTIPAGITTSSNILFLEVNVPSFSHFVIHPITTTPLPIQLVSFDAKLNKSQVDINWETASEVNNDYFTIQRSENGIQWIDLEKINGAGNSTTIINYFTIDKNPLIGTSYYRLQQTDFDGHKSYSEIKVVNYTIETSKVILYPNPSTKIVTIEATQEELSNIKIYNTLGQEVTLIVAINIINSSKITIDISSLANGVYFIKTQTTLNRIVKN